MSFKKYSFKYAAYEVLKRENKPLSCQELVEKGLEWGLLKTNAANPSISMNANLNVDVRKNGSLSKFLKIGPNYFGLIGWADRYGIDISEITYPKVIKRPRRKVDRSGFTPIEDYKILDAVKKTIREIKSYVKGNSIESPS
ncbi:MAG: winged helix-turn-helix domain-containing protein, partial [Methanosarcinales archaeon]